MIANAASITSPATVVITSADAEVLGISLSKIYKMNKNNTFYLETELASNNTHKFTNVTALSNKLCNSHAGFHAYTGCDQIHIPSFAGRVN